MVMLRKNITLVLIVTAAFLFISEHNLYAGGILKEKSINVSPGETLNVDASGADIKIETWTKNEALVKIYGSKKALDKFVFEIEKVSDGVKVLVKKRGSSWFSWSWGGYDLKIEVTVPNSFNSDVNTSGGDIIVKNIRGKQQLNTSGGDIRIEKSDGELWVDTSGGDIIVAGQKGDTRLSTSGGDIDVNNLEGNLKASTSGGDVKVDARNGKILAKTSGGDVEVVYSGNNYGIEAFTSGGDINIKVPSTFKAEVELESSGGGIKTNFSNSRSNKVTRNSFKGEFNGGGELLKCKTTGGRISVNES